MGSRISGLPALCLMLWAPAAYAAPLPESVAGMIRAAAADDRETLRTVVKVAKKAHPDSVAEIDALAAVASGEAAPGTSAAASGTPAAAPEPGGLLGGWQGEAELGGTIKTGNTDETGVSAGLELATDGPRWARDLNIKIDRKSESGELTTDRYFLAYSHQRKLTPRLYVAGVLWGERDIFAGYEYRFSESLGLGYRLFDRPGLKLRVEAGPALRQAEYLSQDFDSNVAARAAGYLAWRLTPRLNYTQSLVAYLDSTNSTLLAASALTTKLEGRLSARFSYEVRHEAAPPADREQTDTTTRLTLVMDF